MKTRLSFTFLICSVLSFGCDKSFLYVSQPQLKSVFDQQIKVKDVAKANALDLIWIIDNSGSMEVLHQSVIDNTSVFIDGFTKNNLDWQMGLVSTDESDEPYLGMKPGSLFFSTAPNAIDLFKSAVGHLGNSGSGTEKTLKPLVDSLEEYPGFVRNGAVLGIISLTDAPEQSENPVSDYIARFQKVTGSASAIYAYGVYQARDLGCPPTEEGVWNFAGSRYEEFMKTLSGYKTLKLCDPNFGQVLSNISLDLVQKVQQSRIMLPFRPKVSTLKVFYNNVSLPGGAQADGGQWYYDYPRNTVTFYDLKFAQGNQEYVRVYAEEDDGLN